MLPNVRLMIAAIFASVVVLVCGFGMFAALRVNHEPLVHLAPATAPLQLAADNAATPSTVVAAGEPFDRRFQISEPHDGGGTSALAYSAIQPAEQPVMKAVIPIAEDHARGVSEPAVIPTAEDHARGVSEPAAVARSAEEPTSSPAAAVAEAERETKPPAAPEATGEPAAAVAPGVAAIEQPTDQALAAEQPKPESELAPASITKTAPEAAHKTVRKARTRRTRVAARTHRARGQRASVVVNSSTQNSMSSQPNFQTAPQASQTQWAQKQHHRSKVTSTTNAKAGSAAGGPFVSPPSR
jgi:hypothetical protein